MNQNKKWYKNSCLKFHCTQCGKCCGGFSGYVWLDNTDFKNISAYLNITVQEFITKYTKSVKGRFSLKEILPCYDCIFFKNKICLIYPVRPKQCQTYPFWKNNIKTKQAWQKEKESCEGIDHQEGKLYTQEEIKHLIES